jgi:hypothetical protein
MTMKVDDRSSSGMSLLELLLAVAMVMVFTGVVAAVMEVTVRFMGDAECPVDLNGVSRCNDENTEDVANGAAIDQQRIEVLFDQLELALAQPGIHLSQIEEISGALGDLPPQQACTLEATTISWAAKVPELPVLSFPRGYHICLWRTGLREASMEDLANRFNSSATPGLYVLQALPTKLNASTLPVRRLFCRPRPFC